MMDDNEDEKQFLRFYAMAERKYRKKLSSAPDCRDPDHPGCEKCDEDWEDYEY